MPSNNINTILIKRSDVSNNVPNTSSLSLGELALNTHDGKLFIKTETPSLTSIKTFLNSDDIAYVYNESLSGVVTKDGGNTISEVFANVLGGYSNDVSGAASTTVNGEDNDIESDFSLIGSGLNNKIKIGADNSFIAAGQNNLITHFNVFTLGSNLSSHAANFTYVNNISSTGKIYGDGSELTGIVSGDIVATTLVRSNSSDWNSSYTTVQTYSADWSTPLPPVILTSDPIKYSFTSDGYSTTYNIGGTSNSTNAALVEVFVGNVRQEPDISYTLSAEKIKFYNAPSLNSRIVIISPNNVASSIDDTVTLVKANSADYNSVYTNVNSNSSNWDISYDISTAYKSISSTFLTSETDSQTLSFSEINKTLSISNSNTVSLSSLYGGGGSDSLPLTGGNLIGSLTAVDITTTGKFYGDGSLLTGIVAGDTEATTLVRSNSANWKSSYTTVNANSASWSNPVRKFDMVYTPDVVSYSGTAINGSLTSQAVWSITKITYNSAGTISSQVTATNAVWDNRSLVMYS